MKKMVRSFVVLVTFAMTLTGLSLAQDATYRVRANIPFEFYAGAQDLPAGTYLFVVDYDTHCVMLRNQTTGRSTALLALPADGDGFGELAELEFETVGADHVLAEVRTADTGVAIPLQKPGLTSEVHGEFVRIVASLLSPRIVITR